MRAHESFAFGPVSATPATFVLTGGKYWWDAVGTFNGATVSLQRAGGDGEFVTVGANASVTVNGAAVLDLPPGTYQVTISASATGNIWSSIVRIPEE